ncbi:MAG: ABC transporter ATP-binding protein [Methanobacteriota archaeon]|nr:MAG: ABC transporter ATP-binding protein [Euryarchaeota archaeon]
MGLEIEDLSVSFGKTTVIEGFNCKIQQGTIGVLLGKSGSGKSTILKTVSGIVIPEMGRILIDGEDVTSMPIRERNIGFVPQHQLLFPALNVYENIAYGLKSRKSPREEIKRRVQEITELVGLKGMLERKPSTLSGGERQRVALGRALAPEPKLLLMDEPFSSLDEAERLRLALVFKQIQQDLGITTVHVTHSSIEADLLADKVIILEKGKVMQEGSFEEVRKSPKTFSTAQLLGHPNVFEDLPETFKKSWKLTNTRHPFILIDPYRLYLSDSGVSAKVVSVTAEGTYLMIHGLFFKASSIKNVKVGDLVKVGYRKKD